MYWCKLGCGGMPWNGIGTPWDVTEMEWHWNGTRVYQAVTGSGLPWGGTEVFWNVLG